MLTRNQPLVTWPRFVNEASAYVHFRASPFSPSSTERLPPPPPPPPRGSPICRLSSDPLHCPSRRIEQLRHNRNPRKVAPNSFSLQLFYASLFLRSPLLTSLPRGDNRDPFFLRYHRCDPLFVFRRNYNSIARLDCPVSTDSPLIIRLPRTLSVSVRDRLYRFETRIYSAV